MSENAPQTHVLLADIGGTHVRFALSNESTEFDQVKVLKCRDHADLRAIVDTYLQGIPTHKRPSRGCFAIASPTNGDDVHMTNLDWHFSINKLCQQLGFDKLEVINDFTAIGHGVPLLGATQRRQVGGGMAKAGTPVGILGPGTGLGVSGLVATTGGGAVLDTAGGHVTLPAMNDLEARVINILQRQFGHASAERALSGPGLVNLYQALATLDGQSPEPLTAPQISTRAMAEPGGLCGKTVEIFCVFLGTLAADLALSLGARGGIYIGGGIVEKLGDVFDHSGFRQRFEAKGRFSAYLADIPTFVITHPYPALLGLAAISHNT